MIEITEVVLELNETKKHRQDLLALGSITLSGCLLINYVKVIRGKLRIFVALPNEPVMTIQCKCNAYNCQINKYCRLCGAPVDQSKGERDDNGKFKQPYRDFVLPITSECRRVIEKAVLAEYERIVSLRRANVSGDELINTQVA
jgi:DNA-binding cell septation regulator SpoVG